MTEVIKLKPHILNEVAMDIYSMGLLDHLDLHDDEEEIISELCKLGLKDLVDKYRLLLNEDKKLKLKDKDYEEWMPPVMYTSSDDTDDDCFKEDISVNVDNDGFYSLS